MERQTKNKPISMISPVQSNDPWRQSRRCQKSIKAGRVCWKGRFWAWSERVKEWWMPRTVMMTKMVWQMNDRVNRDKNGGVNSYYILYNSYYILYYFYNQWWTGPYGDGELGNVQVVPAVLFTFDRMLSPVTAKLRLFTGGPVYLGLYVFGRLRARQ